MRNLILITTLLLVGHFASAQNKWESCTTAEFSDAIMTVEQFVMDKSSYSYETDYLFFDQVDGTTPIMQEHAFLICEKGEAFYIEQFGKTILQDALVQMEIDPVYKTIVLRDPLAEYTTPKTVADFSALDMPGAAIKKKTIDGKQSFYITFPDGQLYVGAEVTLGGPMGITRYVLYAKPTTIENENGTIVSTQPRMEVTYKNFRKGNQAKTSQIKYTAHYLTLNGNHYTLNEEYKNYELIDLRSQPE